MNKRLKELRKKILKLTLKDFGNKIGLSPGGLGDIESGRNPLQERYIKLICQTFNINENWLRYGNEPIFIENPSNYHINELVKKYNINSDEINIVKRLSNLDENTRNRIINFIFEIVKENIDKVDENKLLQFSNLQKNNTSDELCITKTEIKDIRLYKIPASAGTGTLITEYVPYEIKKVDLTIAPQARKADFALYIRGDSMEPNYYDGDIVFVKEQPYINNGQIGIFIYDNETYIKKYSVQEDGIYLVSLNINYKPIKIDENICFKICGLVL